MKTFYSLLALILAASSPASAQETTKSISPLKSMEVENAQRLYFAMAYLDTVGKYKLSRAAQQKASQLRERVGGSFPVDQERIDSAQTLADAMTEKRKDYFSRFKDQSILLSDLKSIAVSFGKPENQDFAAHLLDLVITINPGDVDAAYEREKRLIQNDISLQWKDAGDSEVRLAATSSGDSPRPAASSFAGDGVYEIDLSELAAGASGGSSNIPGLARNQALIKGLLVQELDGSQFAGSASQMNATVVSHEPNGSAMAVRFNQQVGDMMTDAVDSMMAFLKKRHSTLPEGVIVELSFEEQYIPKDGPSAGVACTLMLESLLKGFDYSAAFAVTGALDNKGIVGGVGGIDGKIRGAMARHCDVIAIPSENERVIQDMLIIEGISTLSKIQVVKIETFDEALQIALKHENREATIKQAIETFQEVQGVVNRPNGAIYLKNAKVQKKLREVLQVIPHHLSAKYLLLEGLGRSPTGLTLVGSVQAIDRNAAPLIRALRDGNFDVQDRLAKDSFAETISALTRLRPLLDDRTRPCADAIVTFARHIRTAINNPPRSNSARIELGNKIRTSGRAVGMEYDRLYDRADVKEELMIDD